MCVLLTDVNASERYNRPPLTPKFSILYSQRVYSRQSIVASTDKKDRALLLSPVGLMMAVIVLFFSLDKKELCITYFELSFLRALPRAREVFQRVRGAKSQKRLW